MKIEVDYTPIFYYFYIELEQEVSIMLNKLLTRLNELKTSEKCKYYTDDNHSNYQIQKWTLPVTIKGQTKDITFVSESDKGVNFNLMIEQIAPDGVPVWIPFDEEVASTILEVIKELN